MASVSASHLILFIASVVIAAGVAGTFTNSVGQLSSAIGDQGVDVSEDVRTDVEIISDSGSSVYDGTNLTLLVKNTGSNTLPPDGDSLDIIVDGQYRTDVSIEVLDGPSWTPGNVARVNVTTSLSSGDHRVKLIANGDEEVFRFRS